jgi:hypothetical protein
VVKARGPSEKSVVVVDHTRACIRYSEFQRLRISSAYKMNGRIGAGIAGNVPGLCLYGRTK